MGECILQKTKTKKDKAKKSVTFQQLNQLGQTGLLSRCYSKVYSIAQLERSEALADTIATS